MLLLVELRHTWASEIAIKCRFVKASIKIVRLFKWNPPYLGSDFSFKVHLISLKKLTIRLPIKDLLFDFLYLLIALTYDRLKPFFGLISGLILFRFLDFFTTSPFLNCFFWFLPFLYQRFYPIVWKRSEKARWMA